MSQIVMYGLILCGMLNALALVLHSAHINHLFTLLHLDRQSAYVRMRMVGRGVETISIPPVGGDGQDAMLLAETAALAVMLLKERIERAGITSSEGMIEEVRRLQREHQ